MTKTMLTPSLSIFTDTTDIIAGDAEAMKVPTEKLRGIPFFDACLRPGCFRESDKAVIRLPEDSPEHVEQLLKYVVFNEPVNMATVGIDSSKSDTCGDDTTARIRRLYFLADRLGAEEYQNKLIDTVKEYSRTNHVIVNCFDDLIEAGLEGSQLMDFLTTEMAHTMYNWHWERCIKEPAEKEWVTAAVER